MQWKVQHKAFVNQRKLSNLCLYRKARRRKKRKADKKKTGKSRKTRQRTFMTLFLSYKKGRQTDRCIDRYTPVAGGRIVAEIIRSQRK